MFNRILKFHRVIMFILLMLMVPKFSWSGTYYVSKNGNDENSGSLLYPWKSISKANLELHPGDTVLIRQGTYKETIRPQRSGSNGNPITYARFQDEQVTITDVYDGADLTHRSYIILDGLRIVDVRHWWVNLNTNTSNHAEHNIIKNCLMDGADGWSGINLKNTNYNKILNNDLIAKCGPSDPIALWGPVSYNLIEGNAVSYGTHVSIALDGRGDGPQASYNVIRNNTVWNPWHTGISVWYSANNNLVEGNRIMDSGEKHKENRCGSERDRNMLRLQHAGLQIGSKNLIIRKNVLINNGRFMLYQYSEKEAYNIRIYHNTMYKNYRGVDTNTYGGPKGHIYKNNIITKNREYNIKQWNNNGWSNIFYFNNNISEGIIDFDGQNDPDHWQNNISIDPQFVKEVPDPNVRESDLHLKSESPMIDAGGFLTSTTNGGEGTKITVKDSTYFMDGWGIIEGDKIQLEGQSKIVGITDIDYSKNEITVDKPLSWHSGDGVSLAYSGHAPDIGAYEYKLDSPDTSNIEPPPNLRVD